MLLAQCLCSKLGEPGNEASDTTMYAMVHVSEWEGRSLGTRLVILLRMQWYMFRSGEGGVWERG